MIIDLLKKLFKPDDLLVCRWYPISKKDAEKLLNKIEEKSRD